MDLHLGGHETFLDRFFRIPMGFLFLILLLAGVGFLALYSAAGGSWAGWATLQGARFIVCLLIFLVIALIPASIWFRLAWPAYFAGLLLLLAVELGGHVGMGAQRWLDLGVMKLQPSELMKIAVLMVLARFYHIAPYDYIRQWHSLIIPALIMIVPTLMVFLQPDLGTGLMIIMAGVSIIFMAGVPFWWFGLAAGALCVAIPIAWQFLHDYQKQRVLTFLSPESDPLGAGYHIMQSKIALGSGGFQGKGFLEGTQARLNFLPEKQTDFIFTLWVEEWGMLGALVILALCGGIFFLAVRMALKARSRFSRYLILGLVFNFSLYVFINIAMVMGLIPVVGVPLPLVSYGGTVMLATMCSFGLVASCAIDRDSRL